MKITIIYGSIEGQARKVAQFAADLLQAAGHEVELHEADGTVRAADIHRADRIFLMASVHERRHPRGFEALLTAHRDLLHSRPTLLFSVSLRAACPEGLAEAEDHVIEMRMRTGFTPSAHLLVAGALRDRRYDSFARLVLRNGVVRGRSFDFGGEEREFTDWAAIRSTLLDFTDPNIGPARHRHAAGA